MDDLIKQLLTTGGPLGVLVVVVWIFVNAQKNISQEHRAWMDATLARGDALMARQHDEHLKERETARAIIQQNTAALERNTSALVESKKP